MEKITNYIGGEWAPSLSERWLENWDPASGTVYSLVADSDQRDVDQAVKAAGKAFPAWSRMPALERSQILRRVAQGICDQSSALARAESVDTGKPISLASTVDIPRSQSNFDFFADAISQLSSESYPMDQTALNITQRSPLGVVACISPWNLPLYLLTWKVAPALATGNCVVAKPSEVTPMTAHLFGKICHEAGLPPGALNILHGKGAEVGASLCAHKDVAAISFTGSTKTGADIASLAAPQFKKMSLEMGGKNPTIIFADCNLEEAVHTTVRSAFSNQGQICLCGSRIYVEKSIYETFKMKLVEATRAIKIGDPLTASTQHGAMVSKTHFEKVLFHIDLAQKEGGKILIGGKRVQMDGRCENGWFIEPTLIEGLSSDCRTNQEEIFGPVATIQPFESENEAIQLANSTRYGLAASIWTENLKRAHRVAAQVKSGVVWINCWMLRDLRTPFGGMKDSGVGREGGQDAIRFFSEPKNICFKL